MNYLSHGYQFVERPYFLAGTALPDWLSVADRQVRIRVEDLGAPLEGRSAEVRDGIAQHLADDLWFHTNPVFEEVSMGIAADIRARFSLPVNFRASFLGHILTELLLDATLIEDDPTLPDAYYAALASVERAEVVAVVKLLAGNSPPRLAHFMERFRELQFLRHYNDDKLLEQRLAQVAQRARLRALPRDQDGDSSLAQRARLPALPGDHAGGSSLAQRARLPALPGDQDGDSSLAQRARLPALPGDQDGDSSLAQRARLPALAGDHAGGSSLAQRAGLPALPAGLAAVFPRARERVRAHRDQLLRR